jgi:hypothetical protein
VEELAHERFILAETRASLSGFLTDMLEEVEVAPAANDGSANVPLDEARAITTSTGADD